MELTIKLDDKIDISFFREMLLQIKGVKSVEIKQQDAYFVNDDKVDYAVVNKESAEVEMSDNEYENLFNQLLEKSFNQIDEGKFVEHSEELMDNIFKK